jgi:hypothetical protein
MSKAAIDSLFGGWAGDSIQQGLSKLFHSKGSASK